MIDQVINKMSNEDLDRMGDAGSKRVMGQFSEDIMARRLDQEIDRMERLPRPADALLDWKVVFTFMIGTVSAVVGLSSWMISTYRS